MTAATPPTATTAFRSYADMFGPRIIMQSVPPENDLSDIIADIASLTYSAASRGMDKAVFLVRNEGLKYKDDPRFRANQKYQLRFGYSTWFSGIKKMIVVRSHPTYAMGMPMIELTAYDAGRALALGTTPRNWAGRTSSEIARATAALYGLEVDIEDSRDARGRNQHRIQPASMTPYEYLDALADRIGWDFYVDGGTLHFHSMRTNAAPSSVFRYYTDSRGILKSFSPDVKAAKAPRLSRAGAGGRHPAAPATSPSSPRSAAAGARWRVSTEINHGEKVPGAATAPTAETDTHVRALTMAALQTKIDMAAVTATAELVGCPSAMAREIIDIQGVDSEYAGLWRIKTADHRIDPQGGYSTTLKLHRLGLGTRGNNRHRNSTAETNPHTNGAAPAVNALQLNTERVDARKITTRAGAR